MISIVTPNYNGERWLGECLDSVADQTIDQKHIEMVIVDDGSTDKSKDIIESYSDAIPGLNPIWHEHTGRPGFLRNIGIEKAVGRYVLFLDSDDFLGTEAIERLNDFVSNCTPDVVAFQLQGLNRRVPTSMLKNTIKNADIISSGLYKTLGGWKMFRRQFLDEQGINFPSDLRRGEDVMFSTEAMLKASELSIISGYPFYTVRGREDGTSITQEERDNSGRIDLAARMGAKIIQCAENEDIANHFMIRAFNTDAIDVISNPNSTMADLARIRTELGVHWTPDIERLVYTEENRKKLSDFFMGSNRGE